MIKDKETGIQLLGSAEELSDYEKLSKREQRGAQERFEASEAAYQEYREMLLQMGVLPDSHTDEEYEENRQRLIELGFEQESYD